MIKTIQCQEKVFSNISAILFDKDGTLVNSQAFLTELAKIRSTCIAQQVSGIEKALLKAYGVVNDTLDFTGLMAVGSREDNLIVSAGYIAQQGIGWNSALLMAESAFKQADELLPERSKTTPIFEGVIEVIRALAYGGFQIGIVSADTTANIEAFVAHYALTQEIKVIVGADQGFSKPDPRFYLRACEMLQIDPLETIMVGDSLGDMQMAKFAQAGGLIGVNYHSWETQHLRLADVIIHDLQEIKISEN